MRCPMPDGLGKAASPHISPPFYYARRSARRVGAYSLEPARHSVSYAFAVFRSVPPSQRHLDALATNGGQTCGLLMGCARTLDEIAALGRYGREREG